MPVNQVLEHAVRRILDAVFLLQARAATQSNVPAAFYPMSADIVILLDHNHGGAVLAGLNRGRESASSRAHNDDVRDFVPVPGGGCGFSSLCANSGQGGRAEASNCRLDEISSRQLLLCCLILFHESVLLHLATVLLLRQASERVVQLVAQSVSG